MGQTLTNGIYLPAEGERNCYEGLAANWTALDGMIGGYNVHISNTTIHVTAEDKEAWNGKQDALSQTQLDAVNSGIDSSKVQQIATNTSDISSLQSGKANDNSVVHTSRNETVGGNKTFNSNTLIYNSDATATTPNLYLRNSKVEISSRGNTSGDQNLVFLDKNNTSYAYIKGAIQSNGSVVKIRAAAKDSSDNSVINELQVLAYTNGNKAIFPSYSNEIDLGISSYKWRSFNGLTPSSLSLPSDRSIDISGYITDLTGGNNQYTAPDNGIVAVDISGTNSYVLYNDKLSIGDRLTGSNFRRAGIIPVRKNDLVIIQSDGGTLNYAKFYPCQGNV